MTDRRLMLEKFNSCNYIKNDDKITEYRETEPDQHTATASSAEYSSFTRMPIKANRDLGALQQSPATLSLRSYITQSPAEPEREVRDITGLLTSHKDALCK